MTFHEFVQRISNVHLRALFNIDVTVLTLDTYVKTLERIKLLGNWVSRPVFRHDWCVQLIEEILRRVGSKRLHVAADTSTVILPL